MNFSCCQTQKSKQNLAKVAEFLQVIAEPNRLKILCILRKQEMCVCDIWEHLKLPQNLVSHHLKILKDHNLVFSKKQSTKVIYSANKKTIDKYSLLLDSFIK